MQCIICSERRATKRGICDVCLKGVQEKNVCLNCGREGLYLDSPLCHNCYKSQNQALLGYHENSFHKKEQFARRGQCHVCKETKPLYTPRLALCADCALEIKRANDGWCASCHKKIVHRSPYCRSCSNEMQQRYCVECGEPVHIRKHSLCKACYRKRVNMSRSGQRSQHYFARGDMPLSFYMNEIKKLFWSRKILDRLCRTDVTPEQSKKIPGLFAVESKAYEKMKQLFPEDIFEEILIFFDSVDSVDWSKLYKTVVLYTLKEGIAAPALAGHEEPIRKEKSLEHWTKMEVGKN